MEEVDSIDGEYGATALELIKSKQFPSWGLFIYKDLMKNAKDTTAPTILCYLSTNVLILAPRIKDGQCIGMILALEEASSKVIELTKITKAGSQDYSGYPEKIRIRMPVLGGKTVAMENYYLELV